MKNKVIIITGASDGIGAAAAKRLAADGQHHVVIVGRSPERTTTVAQALGTDYHLADFTMLSEVRALADELLKKYPRIDVLANNAGGVFGRDRRVTQDGHEITFQVNYLASFLLTTRLMDRLLESRATVIFTSSGANRFGNIDINDLESEKKYGVDRTYSDTKLAQILFTRELHRRYGNRGLAAVAFHPGMIMSNLFREARSPFRWLYHIPLAHLWTTSPEQGADTLVFLAEGTPGVDFPAGEYFAKRKVAKANKQADEPALARELWNRSEEMIKGI